MLIIVKFIFLSFIIFFYYPSTTKSESIQKLEQLRPVIEHMKTATDDDNDKVLQYVLIRCAGLFYGASNAEHQRTADAVVEKSKRNKLLFGPKKGLSKQQKGFGKDLHELAIHLQIKFDGSKNNEKFIKKSNLDVNLRINDFMLMYTFRMFDNLENDGTIIKNDKILGDDSFACIGMHEQIFKSKNKNH